MANRRDIAGLLTGIPSGGIDPTVGMTGRQMLTQSALEGQRRMTSGLRGMFGMQAPIQERLALAQAKQQRDQQEELKNLNLENPEDLRKLAKIQQISGDLTGSVATLSKARELEDKLKNKQKDEDTKKANLTALMDLGLKSEAERYNLGGMTDAQASALITTSRNAKRVAQGNKTQLLSYLKIQGIPEDDVLYQEIEAGFKPTQEQLKNLLLQRNLSINPQYTSKNLTLMNVKGEGQKVVGTYTVDNGVQKQEVYGYMDVTENGKMELMRVDPDAVSKIKDKKQEKGIDVSSTDIKRAELRLETAGSRFKGKEDGWGLSDINWDDAWGQLDSDQKTTIATLVAQETQRNMANGMDFVPAEKKAIQDVYIDKLQSSGTMSWNESKYVPDEEQKEISEEELRDRLNRY